MGIFGKTKIDFMGKRRVAYLFSVSILILGCIFLIARRGPNLGIDFIGGNLVQVDFKKPIPTEEVRGILSKGGIENVGIQNFLGSNKMVIRVKETVFAAGEAEELITSLFEKSLGKDAFLIERAEDIGPIVGKDLQRRTLLAVLCAFIGITLYIAFRFELKFGIAATIAVIHDVLIVMAIFIITGREFNWQIVAALLTLAGYSINDTVVVFDRVRENLRFLKKRTTSALKEVMNGSINEVLSRTIVTSITTMLAVGALFVFGGEVIHDFAFALLVGVVVGTYSSIFIASPVVVEWERL